MTERHGSRAGRWNISGTSRRGRFTSPPSTSTRPEVGRSSPAISRSSVDLPQPERPSTATNSPVLIDRLTSRSAGTAPVRDANVCDTSSISINDFP